MPLIEKAYAKIHGSYESLISGFIDDALADMTGGASQKIIFRKKKKGQKADEVYYNNLKGK